MYMCNLFVAYIVCSRINQAIFLNLFFLLVLILGTMMYIFMAFGFNIMDLQRLPEVLICRNSTTIRNVKKKELIPENVSDVLRKPLNETLAKHRFSCQETSLVPQRAVPSVNQRNQERECFSNRAAS